MDISHSEKQVLHLTFLILINLCLSYLPFVTVWASKPWGGQANICLHVLAGIEDSAVGAGCCWVQWFKRAVSSVCTFPSVPLASAVGPCWMQTRRLPQKWHCIYLKQCATPEFSWDAVDPHWLQTTLLTKHYRNVHFWCIFGIFGPVFVFWHGTKNCMWEIAGHLPLYLQLTGLLSQQIQHLCSNNICIFDEEAGHAQLVLCTKPSIY